MSKSLETDYQIYEKVGQGRYGTVYRCRSRLSNVFFAVKSIKKQLTADEYDLFDSRNISTSEPKIHQSLSSNPYIVKFISTYEDDSHLHIVLELCSGTPWQHIIDQGCLSESESKIIITRICKALSYMHKRGVVHRDIKPENILFSMSDKSAKLSDFGSAVFLRDGGGDNMVRVGTTEYMAPEVWTGREYNEKVDVWSAGVVLYRMLAGFVPFWGRTIDDIHIAIMRAMVRFPDQQFGSVSPMAKDLLVRMLCADVSKRFTTDQVLGHPWIVASTG